MKHLPRAALLAAFTLLSAFGCSRVSNSAALTSVETRQTLSTDLSTRVFAALDRNTADFYLTDLSTQDLEKQDLTTLSGSLIHVHVFVKPKPGETPIADEACSFTVRQFVFTNGQVGIYSGGGFLTLSSDLAERTSGGRFRGATLRLTHHTSAFTDRLGPSEMSGSFAARRDDHTASKLAKLVASGLEACAKTASNSSAAPK